ncbi:MAG: hypothetical protein QOK16_3372 [Solirubrobacteraceae bacterium]|jgi:hypothetical protein|nr:hypothetical protein [Solirubrobacteraceae bacterium]
MSDEDRLQRATPATCPSGRCRPGAVLVGIVGPDGRVGYVTPGLPIDDEFVARARTGRTPESRFRFSEPCAEGRCGQWAGDHCGLIDEFLASPRGEAATSGSRTPLPRCGIRASCRWFRERGPDACAICPLVVRSPREPATTDRQIS